ncbi:hypothetical protein B0H11DRAFT_1941451 [Mycena galericulata]|nr:hypothetical protein B0H11DRAFT_1941451 [Mycena galericulata]
MYASSHTGRWEQQRELVQQQQCVLIQRQQQDVADTCNLQQAADSRAAAERQRQLQADADAAQQLVTLQLQQLAADALHAAAQLQQQQLYIPPTADQIRVATPTHRDQNLTLAPSPPARVFWAEIGVKKCQKMLAGTCWPPIYVATQEYSRILLTNQRIFAINTRTNANITSPTLMNIHIRECIFVLHSTAGAAPPLNSQGRPTIQTNPGRWSRTHIPSTRVFSGVATSHQTFVTTHILTCLAFAMFNGGQLAFAKYGEALLLDLSMVLSGLATPDEMKLYRPVPEYPQTNGWNTNIRAAFVHAALGDPEIMQIIRQNNPWMMQRILDVLGLVDAEPPRQQGPPSSASTWSRARPTPRTTSSSPPSCGPRCSTSTISLSPLKANTAKLLNECCANSTPISSTAADSSPSPSLTPRLYSGDHPRKCPNSRTTTSLAAPPPPNTGGGGGGGGGGNGRGGGGGRGNGGGNGGNDRGSGGKYGRNGGRTSWSYGRGG